MKILTTWLRQYLPELSVSDAQLAEDLTLRGIAVEGVFDLGPGNGSLFEMDITTNRVDAMNHYGVTREAATIYGLALRPLSYPLPEARPAARPFSVKIEAPDACGRFTARVLRNVTIGASTGDVARYFALLQQKQISSAVDATNFAWLAMGQPTHAFDLDKIEGGIVVRRARKGERLKTLDGVDRILDPEDLIVSDESRPLGLAGVMGGWETMITPETTNIVVEAAWFDPVAVRRTARRHGLHTDASHRYERGADLNAAPVGSAIVSSLILANGGYLEGELVDVTVAEIAARTASRRPVALAFSELHRLLGATVASAEAKPEGISATTVETYLGALGCELAQDAPAAAEPAWQVTLPSWRLDLEREIDLIEEVARVYGYNRFSNTLPAFSGSVRLLPEIGIESALRATLLAAGLHEAISSTFASAEEGALTAPQPGQLVPLGNPLNAEAGVMRPSLIPGMLTMIAGNLHRDVGDVRLYEIGHVFSGGTERVDQRTALAMGMAGDLPVSSPSHAARPYDFYDLKGLVEQLLSRFKTKSVYFDNFPAGSGLMPGWLHPYRAARVAVDGLTAGWLGQLHPRVAAARKLKQTVLLGELWLDRLYALPPAKPAVRELSRFQPVRRDFSFYVPHAVLWAQMDTAIAELDAPELVDWQVRELRREGGAELAGTYSMLLTATFQAADRTLRDEELQGLSRAVIEAVAPLGARLRS